MAKKIYLDIGHGKPTGSGANPGATYGSRIEAADVIRLARRVGDLLVTQGIEIRYSRKDDEDPDLSVRTADANNWGADYFISFHRNSFSPNQAKGWEAWIYSKAATGGDAYNKAKTIVDNVCNACGFVNRGVKKGAPSYTDFAVNSQTTMASVLMECGFVDSDTDNAIFDSKFEDMAVAIAKGLCSAVGVTYGEDPGTGGGGGGTTPTDSLHGSFSYKPLSSNNFGLRCVWEGNQSPYSNRTNITVSVYLDHYNIDVPAGRTGFISINGVKQSFTTDRIYSTGGTYKSTWLKTFTVQVNHWPDGRRKGVSLAASWNFNGTYSGVRINTITAFDVIDLPKLPAYNLTLTQGNGSIISVNRTSSYYALSNSYSIADATARLNNLRELKKYADRYNALVNGNMDYSNRPFIQPWKMIYAGWEEFETDSIATTYTSLYDTYTGNKFTLMITPILRDGNVLAPWELDEYFDSLDFSGDTKKVLASDVHKLIIDIRPGSYEANAQYYEDLEDRLWDIKDGHLDLAIQMGIVQDEVFDVNAEIEKYSAYVNAKTATLKNNDYLYTGDQLNISAGTDSTHVIKTLTVNGNAFTSGNNYTVNGNVAVVSTTDVAASTVSVPDAKIGDVISVTVNKKKSTNYQVIKYQFGNLTGYITPEGGVSPTAVRFHGTPVKNFTVPESFYSGMLNAKSQQCTFTCYTYASIDSTEVIGETTSKAVFSGNAANCTPELVSSSAKDINPVTKALTNDENVSVKGASNLEFKIVFKLKYGARLKSVKFNDDTITPTVSGDTVTAVKTVDKAETNGGTFTVEDSRGYVLTKSLTTTKSVNYFKPTITAEIKRDVPTEKTMHITFKGTFFHGSFGTSAGASTNSLTVEYRYADKDTYEYSDYIPLTDFSTTGNNFRTTGDKGIQIADMEYTKEYSVQIRITDKIGHIARSYNVGKGIPVFEWGESDFVFNVPVQILNGKSLIIGETELTEQQLISLLALLNK